jgi:hypothetical protein
MATILEFRNVHRGERKPTVASVLAAHGVSQTADIVAFPGVRYDRSKPVAAIKPKRAKRRRDTLELEG